MNRLLLVAALIGSAACATAIDPAPRETALRYAFRLSLDAGNLLGTPIATDPDLKHPVAISAGERALLLLPETRLAAVTLAAVGAEPQSLGQLWLRNIVPMTDAGALIAGDRLQPVTVQVDGDAVALRRCALGVVRRTDGSLELLVYGSAVEPVLRVALRERTGAVADQAQPFDATVEETGAGGVMRLVVLGRYVADVALGEG